MSVEKKVPLEDLMVAMDVVDTLRHRDIMISRELDTKKRREKLIEKLRDIYASQGIKVSDEMLEEGVLALEEKRFVFTPAPDSFSRWLATIYVKRDRWLKHFVTFLGIGAVAGGVYYFSSVRPLADAKTKLPIKIESIYSKIVQVSTNSKAIEIANLLQDEANRALESEDVALAQEKLYALNRLLDSIKKQYSVQIVQAPDKRSGIWRIPPGDRYGKNYYLIVEGVDAQGKKVKVQIQNEEDGTLQYVKSWGIRVNRETFNRIARDKADDGIIQNRVVGEKRSGDLMPSYFIETTGASITQW